MLGNWNVEGILCPLFNKGFNLDKFKPRWPTRAVPCSNLQPANHLSIFSKTEENPESKALAYRSSKLLLVLASRFILASWVTLCSDLRDYTASQLYTLWFVYERWFYLFLLFQAFLLVILFGPEDGSINLLRNVNGLVIWARCYIPIGFVVKTRIPYPAHLPRLPFTLSPTAATEIFIFCFSCSCLTN
jgi:hypothetical protein